MHILYILDRYSNQTETFIRNEIEALNQSEKVIVVIISLSSKKKCHNTKYDNEVEYTKWNIINIYFNVFRYIFSKRKSIFRKTTIKCIQFNSFMGSLKQLKKLYQAFYIIEIILRKKNHHIHAHFATYPTDIAMLVADIFKVPFSFTAHAQDIYTQPNNLLLKKIEKARFVVTCTRYNMKYLMSICNNDEMINKIHCIYHGIDLKKWYFLPTMSYGIKKTINLLSVARLVEKKGLVFLVYAVDILVQMNYRIFCTIIGNGTLKNKLNTLIRLKKLENNVIILNPLPQEEIKNYFLQNDIFILPSIIAVNGDRDGLPNVLLEALATGTPVITTAVSAIPELIEYEKTGMFVHEKNPEAIARTIIRLLNTPRLYQKLIINGREKVENKFDSEFWSKKLYELFISNAGN
jgi:glycosyltransferase involved in cell wall biosynthesis